MAVIIPADIAGLQYVVRNMNAIDKAEIFATRSSDDMDTLAGSAIRSIHSYLCLSHDIPVTAFGSFQLWPCVWDFWMFSTDCLSIGIGTQVVSHFRRVILPDILAKGANRVQCDSLKIHDKAHEFIQRFGGRIESTMKSYGRNGEDFYRFVWDRKSLEAQLPKLHFQMDSRIKAHV